jgi:NADH:ubiquinone oxidoreductase subunit 5 (subunit L)/multisubunit Na+/H+ antiporter MnhA subunit
MEGPTPVSALIHAATMVTAGVYLVLRCSYFFELAPIFLKILILAGGLTALLGASTAFFQYDIKKIIAYSTCSQLGYMFVACGLSRYDISLFHLINHGFFKAALFLCAGIIIHTLSGEQDIRKMGGLKKVLPLVYSSMLISSAALAGIPFFSGFYSKDAIMGNLLILNSSLGFFSYFICLLAALFTSLYSFKILFLVF